MAGRGGMSGRWVEWARCCTIASEGGGGVGWEVRFMVVSWRQADVFVERKGWCIDRASYHDTHRTTLRNGAT